MPLPPRSACCDAFMDVVSADEGTNYWRCRECGNPADTPRLTVLPETEDDLFESPPGTQVPGLLMPCPASLMFLGAVGTCGVLGPHKRHKVTIEWEIG